jgi:hypothetical protein
MKEVIREGKTEKEKTTRWSMSLKMLWLKIAKGNPAPRPTASPDTAKMCCNCGWEKMVMGKTVVAKDGRIVLRKEDLEARGVKWNSRDACLTRRRAKITWYEGQRGVAKGRNEGGQRGTGEVLR